MVEAVKTCFSHHINNNKCIACDVSKCNKELWLRDDNYSKVLPSIIKSPFCIKATKLQLSNKQNEKNNFFFYIS